MAEPPIAQFAGAPVLAPECSVLRALGSALPPFAHRAPADCREIDVFGANASPHPARCSSGKAIESETWSCSGQAKGRLYDSFKTARRSWSALLGVASQLK